jgi:hypothetical protein
MKEAILFTIVIDTFAPGSTLTGTNTPFFALPTK